jgi:hypothetical protein
MNCHEHFVDNYYDYNEKNSSKNAWKRNAKFLLDEIFVEYDDITSFQFVRKYKLRLQKILMLRLIENH